MRDSGFHETYRFGLTRDSGFHETYRFGLEVEILPYYYSWYVPTTPGQIRVYVTAPEGESVIVNSVEAPSQAHSSSPAQQPRFLSDGIDIDEPRWELRNSEPLETIDAAIEDINRKMTLLKTRIDNALGIDLHFPNNIYYSNIWSRGPYKTDLTLLKDEDQMHVQLNVTVPYHVSDPALVKFHAQLQVMKMLQYLQPFLIPRFCKRLRTAHLRYGTTKLDHTFHTFVTNNGSFDHEEDSEQKRVLEQHFINPHVLTWAKNSTGDKRGLIFPDFRYNAGACGFTQGTCNIFGFEIRFFGHVYPLEELNVIEDLIRQIHNSNYNYMPALFNQPYEFNAKFLSACDAATNGNAVNGYGEALNIYKGVLIKEYPSIQGFINIFNPPGLPPS